MNMNVNETLQENISVMVGWFAPEAVDSGPFRFGNIKDSKDCIHSCST